MLPSERTYQLSLVGNQISHVLSVHIPSQLILFTFFDVVLLLHILSLPCHLHIKLLAIASQTEILVVDLGPDTSLFNVLIHVVAATELGETFLFLHIKHFHDHCTGLSFIIDYLADTAKHLLSFGFLLMRPGDREAFPGS